MSYSDIVARINELTEDWVCAAEIMSLVEDYAKEVLEENWEDKADDSDMFVRIADHNVTYKYIDDHA